MSSLLWTAFYEDDVDTFRQLLESAITYNKSHGRAGTISSSPGASHALGTSPTLVKTRKTSTTNASSHTFTRADINWRDSSGLTILHHAASSHSESGHAFAVALIEHPLVDLHLQDHENGWTALHRAFYFGNISLARLMLEREAGEVLGTRIGHSHPTIGLIKVKDREGYGPLDLYAATITDRTLRPEVSRTRSQSFSSDDEEGNDHLNRQNKSISSTIQGDEVYTFGSNRNVTLGFGDEDDRQFPERVTLRRPDTLLKRFHQEYLNDVLSKWVAHDPSFEADTSLAASIPWMTQMRPLVIQDIRMAKLSTAVLTSDPESNLYMCGHGQGGRLGTGDERTRYQFVCVDSGVLSGKHIETVALGQNHTIAVSSDGEIFSWGNNGYGQLGYSLPKTTNKDDDPISTIPRQIFGPLKREVITGIAASRIHSVAFTPTSLYTFGKNDGQLGIVDSDARSLEMQIIPRKVAASLFTASIESASAIDRATICLLDNHEVWIFANYGYAKVTFPLEGFSNYFLRQSFLVTSYDSTPNRIVKITSGGDTVCALSSRGEVFTLSISRHDTQNSTSTTNPAKIRSAITQPQCIWSLKKGNMAARDVGVDTDGSVVLSTEEGSVWKRTKRAHLKDSSITTGEYKPKDYKFSRVPGLTRVLTVRASSYGAYAAVRRDCDVTKTQIVVEDSSLIKHISSLSPLKAFGEAAESRRPDEDRPRFWQPPKRVDNILDVKRAILESKDIEADLKDICEKLLASDEKYDAVLATTTSSLRIPIHRWLLTGRSKIVRRGFRDLCETSTFTVPDLCMSELDSKGRAVMTFAGLDILTIIDLAFYLYSDNIVEYWHIRNAKENAYRYRQIRTELMKIGSKLDLVRLEPAVRQMIEPKPCMDMDFSVASRDPAFFFDGDVSVQLEDGTFDVHSALVCVRCLFFDGLFAGRAAGRWLAGRMEDRVIVDLSHINVGTFKLVVQHLYADAGTELFEDITSVTTDDFLDTVMDVLSAANELMLDRLSQACQSVIGKFVNARNACWLLNSISPSSVHEFKHATLEYICLNLEAMLQGHHLNELEEDLLDELDQVIQQNQLNMMPFAKSQRAELDLHERHPDLAAKIEQSRRAKIDAVRLRSKFQESMNFRPGSVDDEISSPMQMKSRRRSSHQTKTDSDRPNLRSKASTKDMMFAMDEEPDRYPRSPSQSPAMRPLSSPRLGPGIPSSPREEQWYDSRGKLLASPTLSAQRPTPSVTGTPRTPRSPLLGGKTPPSAGSPWSLTPILPARADLKDIMTQSSHTSTLSQSLQSARSASYQLPASSSIPTPKMSQKDRKRMQQQAMGEVPPLSTLDALSSTPAKTTPWQKVSGQKVTSLKDVIDAEKGPSLAPKDVGPGKNIATPQLTMRQTVANFKTQPGSIPPVTARQRIRQPRSVSDGQLLSSGTKARGKAVAAVETNSRPIPQSIRHQPQLVEPSLQLSISDIVAQQQLEKDIIKEAVAKRDLQEIQAEQEFQEWWDKESARVQEAELRSTAPSKPKKHRSRGGKNAPKKASGQQAGSATQGS